MKPKAFAALAFAAALSVLFAMVSYVSNNRWSQPVTSGAPLFPGLAEEAGRTARIELRQGDKHLTLVRDKDSWSLADRGNYPAKAQPVRALIVKLAEAELVDPKTRKVDRYGLLELEDPGAKDAKSRQVRLVDDKGGVIAEAIIGKRRWDAFGSTKGGTYMRKPGDPQTWLSNADLNVSLSVRDWVQPNVLELDSGKINAVSVEIPGEQPLQIKRDAADATKYALVGLPDGKKVKEGADVQAVVRAVAAIELEDVRKLEHVPSGEASLAKIKTDDGLDVTLRLRKDGGDTWLSLAVSGEGDAKKKADEITGRAQGWEFKLPAWKAQAILKRRADFIEAS